MKYLLVTDTHLGIYSDSDVWHNVVLCLFKELHDTCVRENIQNIIHLGDFFHNRKSINTKTQMVAQEIADMTLGLNLFIVVGNHDTYYKNKIQPTSLSMFRKDRNVNIIRDTTLFQDSIVLIPWGGKIEPTHYKYCMGHFEISGFHMNDSYICRKGQDVSIFDQFEKVYSGHFHTPSTKGKVNYLGSPYQQTFHDAGGTRGFYIYEDGELEFREFTNYPHFIKMSTESIDRSSVNGNIIKLTFEKDYGTIENEKIIDRVMSKVPEQLHVDFSKISYDLNDDPEEDLPDMIDHDQIIKDYVDRIEKPTNIKNSTLMQIILKLSEEIKNE